MPGHINKRKSPKPNKKSLKNNKKNFKKNIKLSKKKLKLNKIKVGGGVYFETDYNLIKGVNITLNKIYSFNGKSKIIYTDTSIKTKPEYGKYIGYNVSNQHSGNPQHYLYFNDKDGNEFKIDYEPDDIIIKDVTGDKKYPISEKKKIAIVEPIATYGVPDKDGNIYNENDDLVL